MDDSLQTQAMSSFWDKPEHWLAVWQNTKIAVPFTWCTRFLLWLAFFPSGLTKVLGNRFTTLPVDTPVGGFFEAMYQTGWYYNMLGIAQLLAGLLILLPRTSAIGSILYLCVIFNIFCITLSIGFQGTSYITGLMLLASLYLLAWEYPRWRSLLEPARKAQLNKA